MNKYFFLPMVAVLLVMPGCSLLGSLAEVSCGLVEDSGHCYQSAAIQQSDADVCDKISQPEEFKAAGSNPPKDKCYNTIAGNTGDATVCERMQGGIGSYEKSGCYNDVAQKTENPTLCELTPSANDCLVKIVDTKQERVEKILEETANGEKATDQQTLQLQQEMAELSKFYDMMTNMQKAEHDSAMNAVKNLK